MGTRIDPKLVPYATRCGFVCSSMGLCNGIVFPGHCLKLRGDENENAVSSRLLREVYTAAGDLVDEHFLAYGKKANC